VLVSEPCNQTAYCECQSVFVLMTVFKFAKADKDQLFLTTFRF